MYHYIRNDSIHNPYSKHKLLSKFEEECIFFKKNFQTLNVFDAKEIKKSNDKYLFLTFDDGFKDHLHAAEIMKKHGLFGTFYISTDPYLRNNILPVHKAHIITSKLGPESLNLLKKVTKKLNLDQIIYENSKEKTKYSNAYKQRNDDQMTKEFKKIINYYGNFGCVDQILDQMILEANLKSKPSDFYLSRSEINYISSLGFEIGSHGSSHKVFSRLKKSAQFNDIKNSKLFLEETIGKKINTFSYPYGRKMSYNKHTINILKKLNFAFSMAIESRDIDINDLKQKPFELPRYDCNEIDLIFQY